MYWSFKADGTETLAYPQSDGSYSLHGYKWFSSATDSDMSLALARTVNQDGSTVKVRLLAVKSYKFSWLDWPSWCFTRYCYGLMGM